MNTKIETVNMKSENVNTKTKRINYYLFTLNHDSCGEPKLISDNRLYMIESITGQYLISPTLETLYHNYDDKPTFMKTLKVLGLFSNKWDYRSDWTIMSESTLDLLHNLN